MWNVNAKKLNERRKKKCYTELSCWFWIGCAQRVACIASWRTHCMRVIECNCLCLLFSHLFRMCYAFARVAMATVPWCISEMRRLAVCTRQGPWRRGVCSRCRLHTRCRVKIVEREHRGKTNKPQWNGSSSEHTKRQSRTTNNQMYEYFPSKKLDRILSFAIEWYGTKRPHKHISNKKNDFCGCHKRVNNWLIHFWQSTESTALSVPNLVVSVFDIRQTVMFNGTNLNWFWVRYVNAVCHRHTSIRMYKAINAAQWLITDFLWEASCCEIRCQAALRSRISVCSTQFSAQCTPAGPVMVFSINRRGRALSID